MKIRLNGEMFECAQTNTLHDLVLLLELEGKRYAIEHNKEIVPKSEHSLTQVNEGDVVEVVQAIGGG